jgi:hypothetical protein
LEDTLGIDVARIVAGVAADESNLASGDVDSVGEVGVVKVALELVQQSARVSTDD